MISTWKKGLRSEMTACVTNCARDSMTNVSAFCNCFSMAKYKLKICSIDDHVTLTKMVNN